MLPPAQQVLTVVHSSSSLWLPSAVENQWSPDLAKLCRSPRAALTPPRPGELKDKGPALSPATVVCSLMSPHSSLTAEEAQASFISFSSVILRKFRQECVL